MTTTPPSHTSDYIQWVFSPHVGVLCGDDAEQICMKNNLKFVDLLQPFCTLDDEVGVSDPNGTLVTVRKLNLVLQDVNSKPPSSVLAKKILNHVVTTTGYNSHLQELDVSNINTPWYEKWRRSFHLLQHPFDHEFTKHLLACVIVISSSHGSKSGEEAQRLSLVQHQMQHQPSLQGVKYTKWFSPNILKYYLVLHDASTTTKEVGNAAYQSVNSVFSGYCHILTINSGAPSAAQTLPNYWQNHSLLQAINPGYFSNSVGGSEASSSPASPQDMGGDFILNPSLMQPKSPPDTPPSEAESPHPLSPDHPLSPSLPSMEVCMGGLEEVVVNVGEVLASTAPAELGGCLNPGDIANMKQFVSSFVRGALIPHVERQVRHLTEVVANRSRSKSILSATRRWLGGSKNPSLNSSSGNSVLYSSEATELQTRRLADLAFMFCMYDVAYQNYHTAKNDFKSDQAWLYYAGAQEMAALSLFMQNGIEFPKRYLEVTWDTLSSVCKATNLGIRLLVIACDILKHNRCYSEAAMYYIKLTSEDSDLLSALMLEQAASCFLNAGHVCSVGFKRKFAFHMTLAAHRYSKAGQKSLSLRANALANKIYGDHGLVLAEDHITYSVGKYSALLRSYIPALDSYTHLIDAKKRLNLSSQQSVSQQLAYFREFLSLYKLIQNHHDQVDPPKSTLEGIVPDLPELPIPWFNTDSCKLLIDATNLDNNDGLEASGVTLENVDETMSENWLGLERLAMESVYKHSNRAVPALFTSKTDNSRNPEISINQPCCLEMPIKNPLLFSIAIGDMHLSYNIIGLTDENVFNINEIETFVLAPGETKNVRFTVKCSKLCKVSIGGVKYSLSLTNDNISANDDSLPSSLVVINGFQGINIKGPRLNNNLLSRTSVSYGLDKRLELSIIEPLPKLRVVFSEMPEALLCGQVIKLRLSIENIGSLPIDLIRLANSDPIHTYFVPEDSRGVKQTGERVVKIPLPSNKPLGVGEKCSGYLWIKAQQHVGLQHLLLVFLYRSEINNSGKTSSKTVKYLRHQSTFTVMPSVGISVKSSLSQSDSSIQPDSVQNVGNLYLDIRALDSKSEFATYSVVGISGHSKKWKLKFEDSKKASCALKPLEVLSALVKASSCEIVSKDMTFSLIPFGDEMNEAEIASSEIFAKLARVELSPLTAIADMPAPNADCEPPEVHKALEQYLYLKESSLIDMVVTVHWRFKRTATESSVIFGQHNIHLTNLGDSASTLEAFPDQPDDSQVLVVKPAQIIPNEPPFLPSMPTDFSLSVGLDVSKGDGGQSSNQNGCLTVAQATSLYHEGEVDVSKDLRTDELKNCVKVIVRFVPFITHDFTKNKICSLNLYILVHNTTNCELKGLLQLNRCSSLSVFDRQSQSTSQSSIPQSIVSPLRFTGCVSRNIALPPLSMVNVPCQAVILSPGVFSLGFVSLSLKTADGIRIVREIVLDETLTVE